MVYIYNASLWCDDCGEKIREELEKNGTTKNVRFSYDDSDKWPLMYTEEETEGPEHCSAQEDCINAIDLIHYGAPSSDKIGARVDGGLTDHGVSYLLDLLAEEPRTPYSEALHKLWVETYADYLPREYCDRCEDSEPFGDLKDATDENGDPIRVCWLCEEKDPGIKMIPQEHKGQGRLFGQ